MEQESPDDPIPSREEVEALRAAIVSRDDLVDFLDALIEYMEHDKSTWEKTVATFLADIAAIVSEGRLSARAGGGALPEVPTWKTLGDIFFDAVYRP